MAPIRLLPNAREILWLRRRKPTWPDARGGLRKRAHSPPNQHPRRGPHLGKPNPRLQPTDIPHRRETPAVRRLLPRQRHDGHLRRAGPLLVLRPAVHHHNRNNQADGRLFRVVDRPVRGPDVRREDEMRRRRRGGEGAHRRQREGGAAGGMSRGQEREMRLGGFCEGAGVCSRRGEVGSVFCLVDWMFEPSQEGEEFRFSLSNTSPTVASVKNKIIYHSYYPSPHPPHPSLPPPRNTNR